MQMIVDYSTVITVNGDLNLLTKKSVVSPFTPKFLAYFEQASTPEQVYDALRLCIMKPTTNLNLLVSKHERIIKVINNQDAKWHIKLLG